jgi:hypothetical protein
LKLLELDVSNQNKSVLSTLSYSQSEDWMSIGL